MALSSPRFAPIAQCRQAAENAPPLNYGASGLGVAAVQRALADLGFPLPVSMRGGAPDGKYGAETVSAVRSFQNGNGLSGDGSAGRNTMHKLDSLFPASGPTPGPTPTPTAGLPYSVPGFRVVIAQPTSLVCWATVHCMMRSWKQQQSFEIRRAAAAVEEKYGVMVDNNQALPSAEFGPFIRKAGMEVQPMMNLTIEGWLELLRGKGLIWVGTLNAIGPGAGLHSRIVEGMSGDGSATGTYMHIIDPDGGRQYRERFDLFLAKYEGAFRSVSGDYFQIRHFR